MSFADRDLALSKDVSERETLNTLMRSLSPSRISHT